MDYQNIYIKLFEFVQKNDTKQFIDLLLSVAKDEMFDINIRNKSDKYFLSYAILANNIEIVNLLIKFNARLDIENDRNSILTIPIHYDNNEMIEVLLKGDSNSFGPSLVDYRDRTNKIPLHHAIEKKNIEAIKILLKYKSNPNIFDKDGSNALFFAVRSKSLEICKLILPGIYNINSKNMSGENVLHLACNLQLYEISKFLIENGIDINVYNIDNEMTPLHFAITTNNKKLLNLLIENGANINAQNVNGNTVLHNALSQKKYEIVDLIFKNKDLTNNTIFNLWNIEGDIPLMIFLKNNIELNDSNIIEYFELLVEHSNLNIQDRYGYSPLYYIIKNYDWKQYIYLLNKKKLDIFVKNKKGEIIIDIVQKQDYDDFINLLVDSYLYNLTSQKKIWTEEWDIICGKNFDALTENEKSKLVVSSEEKFVQKCKTSIKDKIINIIEKKNRECNEKTFPMVKPNVCVNIVEGNDINLCTFTGNLIDILTGIIYLLKKHKNVCSLIAGGDRLLDRDFQNFEIEWEEGKLNIGKNFIQNFNRCVAKKRFVIIPIGIQMDKGGHAGYLIFDSLKKEIERFETYGGGLSLHGAFYNSDLFDSNLESKFKEIDENIKYIRPRDYLPKIGFQSLDIINKNNKKIGDPNGFCSLWAIWYVDMRLTYKEIERTKLVNILINSIKTQNISFKNMIRNYSAEMISIRDNLLMSANLNINDWTNHEYTDEQHDVLYKNTVEMIKTL